MRKDGYGLKAVEDTIRQICIATNDEETELRINAVHNTFDKNMNDVAGTSKLRELLGIPQITPLSQGKKEIFSAEEILKMDIPPVEWIVQTLIPKRGIIMLGGDNGSLKSYTMLHFCLSCITSTHFLGEYACDCQDRTIVIIDEENRLNAIKTRLGLFHKGLEGKSLENLKFLVDTGWKLDNPVDIQDLEKHLDSLRPGIIVMDSLVRFFQGEENSAKDVKKIFDNIKGLMGRYDCSILLLHHKRKDSNPTKNSLRGSSDLSAFCDSILMIEKKNRERFILSQVKNRHAEEAKPIAFDFAVHPENGPVFSYKGVSIYKDVKVKAADDIRKWVNETSTNNFSTGQIKKIMKEHGHADNATYDALKSLVISGFLEKKKQGLYEVIANLNNLIP